MLFSYKELKKMANLPENIDIQQVVQAINSIGFEVETIKPFGNVEGIKFGQIIAISKNANADKLNVCEVKFEDKNRIIQTNADNVFEGMYVIAFVPGSKMGNITFTEKELKGIVSEGMLTSLNEFGIDKSLLRDGATDGIQEYPKVDLKIDPIEYLGLNDTIIEVDILSNRSDAQSYYVMAMELAAFFGTKIEKMSPKEKSFQSKIEVKQSFHSELSFLEAKNDFSLSFKEKILLAKSGIKSKNDIIDLTNLTLIMTGQPIHAYDKNKIGNSISTSKSSQTITILGGEEIKLNNTLVIVDETKPISVAGVMGIEETSISNNTSEFVIELGHFESKDIRASLKTIKILSLSGIQSSKHLAKGTIQFALDYLRTKLNTFSNVVNFTPENKKIIPFSATSLEKVAGFEILKNDLYKKAINSLTILGYEFLGDSVAIPEYRHDISIQQDLNEEIFRFYGYDNFPMIAPTINSFKVTKNTNLKNAFASMGYNEAMTYSLISKEQNTFNPFQFSNSIELKTFVSKKREVIRDSQLFSLSEAVEYNLKRNIPKVNLFSVGLINNGIETLILASNIKTINEIKSDLLNKFNNLIFMPTQNDYLHPGVSADIYNGKEYVGYLGKINPKFSNYDIVYAEIKTTIKKEKLKIENIDSSPLKHRDITFELSKSDNIHAYIKNIDAYETSIIDTFEKDGKNKITVRFTGNEEEIKNIDSKFNKGEK